MRHKTRGLTFVGMLLTMTTFILFGLFAMRIIPVYIQHYTVVQSLHTLQSLPAETLSDDLFENAGVLKKNLLKQFEIENIADITDPNIQIEPGSANTLKVTIKYQVTRPFISNISLLFNFENSQEVPLGRE